jgi:hypothetical protein
MSGKGGVSHTFPPLRFLIYSPPPVWLEANFTVMGEVFSCIHPLTKKTILAFKVGGAVDGFIATGLSWVEGDPGKGSERNQKIPNPNDPSQPIKRKKAPGQPHSGYRERTVYGELTETSECKVCPEEGWTGIDGAAFIRGSAGVGWGYQFNIQKVIDNSFMDISQGWGVTGSRSWRVTGISLEAGVTVSGGLVGYLQ